MYDGIRSYGGIGKLGFIVTIYFVVLFIVGNCILFVNLLYCEKYVYRIVFMLQFQPIQTVPKPDYPVDFSAKLRSSCLKSTFFRI